MKNRKRSLAVILILLLATLMALTACNFNNFKTHISNCEVSLSAQTYEYTGQAITPEVTVKYAGKILQKDVDYTVEYSNNIEVGKGRVKISGIGDFNGEVVKEFVIKLSSGANNLVFHFYAPNAEFISGDSIQVVESVDEIVVPIVRKSGYDFLYWTYNGKEVNFDDKESLPNSSAQFEAKFSVITYTIEYVLNGGVNSPDNKEEFTVEDIFELQDADASNIEKKFVGWYLDKNFQEKLTSLSGVTRNLVLYAKYVNIDDTTTLSYVLPDDVDASEYKEQTLYPGTALTRPASVISQDGSKKLVWYIDEDMSIRHNLHYMPDSDLTLYARWEDVVYSGFLDRGWYKITDIRTIGSYEDMLAFVEFILFYNIHSEYTPKRVTYVSGRENIQAEVVKALGESTFPRMLSATYKCENNTCCVYMSSSVSGQATLSATDEKDYYLQVGNVFNNYESNRSATFDEFAINYVENEYECSTSDQLFYVLSHGYRPLLSINTPAYRIYNQFKTILRSICDDRMKDLQKARAIFDWLVVNVYYDYNVAEGRVSQASYKYNAFYIEGVLNGSAVCDGLSKAYAVMCAIEGIDCVRVTGKLKDASAQDAGHAWNKIQLMGEWFISDATWGNPAFGITNGSSVNYYEYVNGKYFLFTDEERSEVDNYNSNQYSQYVADSQFNYYANFKLQLEITIKTGIISTTTYLRTFDLYLDGDDTQGFSAVDELSYIFEYIDKSGMSLEGMSFSVMLGEDMSAEKVSEAFNRYVSRVGILKTRIKSYNTIVKDDPSAYNKGSAISIVFSLPQNNTASQMVA
ncbi:MAG: InlB B-repeat-containing protein [Clostridia bacterium]|nr:InlB B-repeat-containing protein [Clostridia bacterium]